ncbi:MAG TPA: DUF333 domain-containing protein [Nitrosopumilaceae archaeon]|nr:DUF333 domain-containing protein [Nitrosopumilaceae archaeon]
MKKYLKIGIIVGILAIIAVSMYFIPGTRNVEPESGNPASKYCLEHGGTSFVKTVTTINGSESQEGICEFPNGSQCEEWQYFRGECSPAT